MNFPQMGENVPVSDLVALNKALRKSSIGYQTSASPDASAALSPLVPQSLESTLASKTYTMQELALWPRIAKQFATQTVHEYNVLNDQGLDLDPFIAEGDGGQLNTGSYSREFVKIRFLAERRQISDVAGLVGLRGPNTSALAEETQRGTERLLQKLERSLFHAESASSDRAFDGIIRQIEKDSSGVIRSNSTEDLGGGSLSIGKIQETCAKVYGANADGSGFGKPNVCMVEPQVYSDLIQSAVASGRHDQLRVQESSGITFGVKNLTVMAPYGPVQIVSAPFLFNSWEAPSAASTARVAATSSSAPAAPVFSSVATAAISGSEVSHWNHSDDNGAYFYQVVAVSKFGYSAPTSSGAQTLSFGGGSSDGTHKVTLTMNAASDVDFYRVYRSTKGGAVGTCKLIGEFKAAASGTTAIVDLNYNVPNTSRCLLLDMNPQKLRFMRLLDFLRRPLAETATAKPFLLMMFGSPIVSVPEHMFSIRNVGTSTSTSGVAL